MSIFSLFKKKKFCKAPFEQAIVVYNGDVWFCCDALWRKPSLLGNLNESSFDKIWNSKFAQNFRKLKFKNDDSYCCHHVCENNINGSEIFRSLLSPKKINYKTKMKTYPRFVQFNTDCECNVRCITCRKDIYRLSDQDLAIENDKIEQLYLPMLKDAELVIINGCGEALASRHSRALIKAIANKYPDIRFCLLTNGLLCDEFNLKELGIYDRIAAVIISLNAATKEIYNKVVLDSNFDRVMKNASSLKERVNKGEIKSLVFTFVITVINYKEIPEFIKLCNDFGIVVQFLCYRDWKNELNYLPEYLAVHNPNHPEHQDFLQIYNEYVIPYINRIISKKPIE